MIDNKICKKCFWSVRISSGGRGDVYCDYYLRAGKRRPKEIDGKCPVFDGRKKPFVRKKYMDYIFMK